MMESGQRERMFVPSALVQLPPFPTVAVRVLKLASDTDSSLQQLSDTIATDPVFGSEILRDRQLASLWPAQPDLQHHGGSRLAWY